MEWWHPLLTVCKILSLVLPIIRKIPHYWVFFSYACPFHIISAYVQTHVNYLRVVVCELESIKGIHILSEYSHYLSYYLYNTHSFLERRAHVTVIKFAGWPQNFFSHTMSSLVAL